MLAILAQICASEIVMTDVRIFGKPQRVFSWLDKDGITSAPIMAPPGALSCFTKVVVLPFIANMPTLCGTA